MAIPQPTGCVRSAAWIGRGCTRSAASASRVANRTRHAHPASRSMAASAADIKDPANENGRGALAMNVSRTIEVGRTSRVVLAGVPTLALALTSGGRTAVASSSPRNMNDQKAKHYGARAANVPPTTGTRTLGRRPTVLHDSNPCLWRCQVTVSYRTNQSSLVASWSEIRHLRRSRAKIVYGNFLP